MVLCRILVIRHSKLNRCVCMYDVSRYRFLPFHVSRALAALAFYAHATQIEHCSRIHIQLHRGESMYSLASNLKGYLFLERNFVEARYSTRLDIRVIIYLTCVSICRVFDWHDRAFGIHLKPIVISANSTLLDTHKARASSRRKSLARSRYRI